jgi:hypothetical protein
VSDFDKLSATFDTNWTTILVGWQGLGVLSPWPERWVEFPPLISAEEIADYSYARLVHSSDANERDLIEKLLSVKLQTQSRQEIRNVLKRLSDMLGGNEAIELRKWRMVLLEDLLGTMPKDALYGLMALSEFWQKFGFPADSPHVVQGRGNTITPSEYFQQENLDRLLGCHQAWLHEEKAAIMKQEMSKVA